MQHVAFHVDSLADVLAMRDRLRSRGVQVLGPIDHGFTQSIYFDGPEGLNLEICCGTHIDGEAWIDPEVVGLCGITEAELEALKEPAGFERDRATGAAAEHVRTRAVSRTTSILRGIPESSPSPTTKCGSG